MHSQWFYVHGSMWVKQFPKSMTCLVFFLRILTLVPLMYVLKDPDPAPKPF